MSPYRRRHAGLGVGGLGLVSFLLDPRYVMNGKTARSHADGGRDRVLIVDDDADAREVIAVVLTQAGYSVDVAENGHDALGKVTQSGTDLVLTDLQMPGMHGLDLIQNLRQIDGDLPVVLATGMETKDLCTNADLYGAVACLEKPIDLDELFWTIDLALACRRGLRHAAASLG